MITIHIKLVFELIQIFIIMVYELFYGRIVKCIIIETNTIKLLLYQTHHFKE